MKNIHIFTFLGIVILAMVSSCNSDKNTAQEQIITILHTNDIHGSYNPFYAFEGNATAQTGDSVDNYMTFPKNGEIGGFARIASAIKSIRSKKDSASVLLLDGGDTFSDDLLSNITKGEVVISLMNELDYDMMVLGNHDFDYGLSRTKELAQMANFPMRAANVIDSTTNGPIFNEAYKIIEKNNVRIGVLPIAYRNTNLTGNPKNMEGIRFEQGLATIKKYLPEIKDKSDIIIVLSHEGMSVDKIIAEEIDGIDLIVGAHSHDFIRPPYKSNGTFVVQAMSDAAILAETELIIKDRKLMDVKTNYHFLYADEWEEDPEILEIVQDYRKVHKEELEEYVAIAETSIGRQYKMESPFDKLVTSILMDEMNADVAFMPGVGYGITLQDKILKEDVFKLIPHNSKIITLNLTGKQLLELLEQTATNLKPKNIMNTVGGLLQSSGITYTLDLSKSPDERIIRAKIDGKDIDLNQTYKVATHSGMLNGIHNYIQFAEGTNIQKTDTNLNDFIVQKLQEMKDIKFPKNMGEVTILGKH
ncbi:bifunctional metallophosphatase/5'-nucleotidase [Zunongwangia profunda]|uniref:bifunctional metallophosphatase/5'-nucleotidase n=1 Tax=Zunongwangia profunda TaxID=398743 RepID=UPI001D18A93B|nr:bifunctional UDP-sugar hydrolase/5'-nucleotidase [Zunongwangia profunda]MCC4227739.1 bifunctional metallophosphatase/5'-nucleotidase [Zunongwangia profunda]|tara:strand:+ start:6415 stop:8007 length:1593 start_codon:yes stop_codon:yes gene_type:complete